MRTKVTLILLLLNVALFFYIFYVDRRIELADTNSPRVLKAEDVTPADRLEIRRADAVPVVLEKRNDTWFLGAPYDWPANPNAIDRILNELLLLEGKTKFAVETLGNTGQKLADYGLNPAALTLLIGRGDKRLELKVGAVTHVKDRLYVLSPSGKYIHVVNRGLADALQLTPDQLRDDKLFDIPVFEARSLVVAQSATPNSPLAATPNSRVRIVKSGARWLFESPIQTRADKLAVELTLNRLRELKVARFLDPRTDDPRVNGLDNPALRLTVEGNQRSVILLLGAAVPPAERASPVVAGETEYYARLDDRTRPAVFTVGVNNALLEFLRNAQTEMRARQLLDFDDPRLSAIALKAPGQNEVTLQRLETGKWQVLARTGDEAPLPQPADPEIVQRLLEQLHQARAESFRTDVPLAAELEEWGFNRPVREVALSLTPENGPGAALGVSTLTLLVGATTELQGKPCRFARLTTPQFVYLVRADLLDELPVEARYYRERTVRTLEPGARIVGLALKRLADGQVLFAQQLTGDQTWDTALAAAKPEVRDAVLQLRDELRTLRARRFVRDSFANTVEVDGQPQPWRYELEATIALTGAGEQAATMSSKLFLGDRRGGSSLLVGSAQYNTIFEASQPLLDAAFALTFGDRDPGPAPESAPKAEAKPEAR